MKRNLLDSYAILVLLNQEPGFQKIQSFLQEAKKGNILLLMSEINLGEVYYQVLRRRDAIEAERIFQEILNLPIQFVSVSRDIIFAASRFKSQYPISFADCIAAATAINTQSIVITGDKDFELISHLVDIEWL